MGSQLPNHIGRLQPVVQTVARPLFRLLWKIDVQGLEHVPAGGPAILCPNHLAAIDSFLLPAVLPRGITYVGKAEYLDDWKTAKLFPALGMIPIDRRGGDHAAAALDAARQVLQRGGLFGIYPEGTRSRSGKLHKGHTGAARLAIETGAPIVPVGLIGTAAIQPPDQSRPNFFRPVTVRIGEPISVDRYRDRVGDRATYRQLTDELMFEIQALCGQEYEHTYAGSTNATPTATDQMKKATKETASTIVADGRPDPATNGRRSSADVLVSRPLAEVG